MIRPVHCFWMLVCVCHASELKLHYGEPAKKWTEALPIGNGRFGAMIFGATAGVAEMLLQSHLGQIDLLPALPVKWSEGKVTGLRARGGFHVDITWKGGKVTTYRIASTQPGVVKVKINGEVKTITSEEQ